MAPKRIQRKRTKGWKMPDNTIYVGRPGKWGNPFSFSGKVDPKDKSLVVDYLMANYKRWLNGKLDLYNNGELVKPPTYSEIVHELRGKDLACWCGVNDRCHADILLIIANL